MNDELQIHGSIFFLFQKFIESNCDPGTWQQLIKDAGTNQASYDVHANYPAASFFSLLTAAAACMHVSEHEAKEKFGEYLVPDLLNMYKSYIDPTWKTFQMLENTELVMHKAARRLESKANPPVLHISRVHDKLLIIDYYSKRKLAGLAIGIIKGIAAYFNEREKVQIIPSTNPDDERVQLRIEFI